MRIIWRAHFIVFVTSDLLSKYSVAEILVAVLLPVHSHYNDGEAEMRDSTRSWGVIFEQKESEWVEAH